MTFDEIVGTYTKPLLRYISCRLNKKLKNRVCPEDILQDVFAEAYKKYPKFLETKNVAVQYWIYRIATDSMIEAHRHHFCSQKRSVAREEKDTVTSDGKIFSPIETLYETDRFVDEVANGELADIVRQQIKKLSKDDQDILWLRIEEGLGSKESSELLGINKPTECMRYLRALNKLKLLKGKMNDTATGLSI